MVAAACGDSPARSSTPAPADWAETDGLDLGLGAVSPTLTPSPTSAPLAAVPWDESSGLIAAAGPTGLRLLRPDGTVEAEVATDRVVTQPTWSRDGRRLAATIVGSSGTTSQVAVLDMTTGQATIAAARRPYFFYSWSHDGTRLAALGPGSSGGTALDILDSDGKPTSESSLQGSSLFVAWEPEGRRLLLHAGTRLLLLVDPDSLDDQVDLGIVGADFQAPAWVPGSSEFLYVDSGSGSGDGGVAESDGPDASAGAQAHLRRRGADGGDVADLGPVSGFALMAAHPDGRRVALSLPPTQQASGPDPLESIGAVASSAAPETVRTHFSDQTGSVIDEAEAVIDQAVDQAQSPDGSVDIVDLATSERTRVLDQQGLWLEWSPDGSRLLMAALTPGGSDSIGLTWHTWDGGESTELASFVPTEAFLRNYLPFADQYTETPRLWAPDGTAVAFGAQTESGDVSAVARLDEGGRVESLGTADVAFWSPASAGRAPSDEAG